MGYSVLLLSTIIVGIFFHQMPLSRASFLLPSPTNEEGVDDSGDLQRRGNIGQRPPRSSLLLTSSKTYRHVQQNRNNESVSWLQIGSDIEGSLISLSDDGMRVVVADSGLARVYEQDTNGGFIQVGNSIDYSINISSIDISSDGKRVVVGASADRRARIFEEVNGSWMQIGNAIEDDANSYYQYSTQSKISGDGKRVIVGSVWEINGDDEGHVRVFEEQNNRWVPVGEIVNKNSSLKAGHDNSFDISMDGKRIIFGNYFDPSYYAYDTGIARVFEEINGTWFQVGAEIEEFSGPFTTFSISLSGNGKRLMVGANDLFGNGFIARVFQEKDGEWVQVGSDFTGCEDTEATFDNINVDLSGDGMSAIIGMAENDESARNAGRARIYKDINGSWMPVGNDIFGDMAGDRLGYSLSLSGDGRRVALKAGLITFRKFYSRVYELTTYTTTIAPQPTSAPKGTSKPTSAPKGTKGKGSKGGKGGKSSKAPKIPKGIKGGKSSKTPKKGKGGKGSKGGKSSKVPKSSKGPKAKHVPKSSKALKSSKSGKTPKIPKGIKGGKSSKTPKKGKGGKGSKGGKGGKSSKVPKSSKGPKAKHVPKSSKALKSSKSGKSKSTKGRLL